MTKEGQVIDRVFVEKKGKKAEVIIRLPKKNDVKAVWKFYNKVIKETENLSRVSVVSLSEEKKWIDSILDKMGKKNMIQVLAESNGEIIGSASIERKPEERRKHGGEFGIAIIQNYTGLGLGKALMKILEENTRQIGIEIITLHVHGKNKIARNLYRKMGFKDFGKVPNAIKIKRGFDDDIFMYKVLKK